ncbi:cytosol aminopeptidase isoform X1 [Xenopus tropicalis]|uniref:Cytosol aminopeptidase n=1 Tax=Xenopus tropicalis TaxID=8364 RepID=A0A8J0T1Q9_XENTR|nr:cytosol aminopeptidase isoform X1 [Xenopus tropicalis]|eukprot:XP_017948259.1 PREDICTED: cytosol aminopeptidase isoform X1 [Xenopus tropicalis]
MLPFRTLLKWSVNRNCCRGFAVSQQNYNSVKKGLVLGVYEKEKEEESLTLTNAGDAVDNAVLGKLRDQLARSGPSLKKGKSRIFYGLHEDFPSIVVVGLGKKSAGVNQHELWNEAKENIRAAVSVGCRQMQDMEIVQVEVDPCGDAQAAAEGAVLGLFEYNEMKKKKKKAVTTHLHGSEITAWEKGVLYAEGQNLARHLMEAPANYITPTKFAETFEQRLANMGSNVKVFTRSKQWIEEQQMGAFLSVAKGSEEPPVFLEIHYSGSSDASQPPLVFVGKGVTFDSGGISLKPSSGMDAMRGDMGGAATVCSAITTAAKLKLPINIISLAPLCENMPNGRANKPGDVVKAKNGKTIQVDNTDAEGRLLLADALCYAHSFNPRAIVNAATLTGAMDVALGSAAAGVFTNSSWLWTHLQEASVVTGDRVWRMPLFEHYSKQVTESALADLNNIGKYSRSGGACTAAAFLKEFVTAPHWAHLDIAGVMSNKDEVPYLRKGMSGRPTRTLIEFAARLSEDKQTI